MRTRTGVRMNSCLTCAYYDDYYCDRWSRDVDSPCDSSCRKYVDANEVAEMIIGEIDNDCD